jgi:uncharacterized membrane protein
LRGELDDEDMLARNFLTVFDLGRRFNLKGRRDDIRVVRVTKAPILERLAMRFSLTALLILPILVVAAYPANGQSPSPAPSATAAPSAAPSTWGNVQTLSFEACNDSASATIFVAIAHPEEKSETSRGWWRVDKGTCTKVGTFPIDHKSFGIYADAREGRFAPETRAWGGPAQYCVNIRAAFAIKAAARKGGGLCNEQQELRGFVLVTPAMLFPNNPDRQNDSNLSFKYTFR